jgi:hypothetical protein
MFENRVLRRIFGQKRAEVVGGWTKLRNEELHNLYFSSSKIIMLKSKRSRWARIVEKRNAYCILVGKLEGKGLLGRLKVRWKNNIKMDLRYICVV